MIDLTKTTAPKSDQLNADDLIGGPITITVTSVRILGEADQPVGINFEGDNGKPYKPGKSMRRILVHAWGGDGEKYVGRSMRLYCDPNVMFGGAKVGGIRISHLSHIERDLTVALTTTRAQRKPFTVKPLKTEKAPAKTDEFDIRVWATEFRAKLPEYTDGAALQKDYAEHSGKLSDAARDFMDEAVSGRLLEIDAPAVDDDGGGFPGDH